MGRRRSTADIVASEENGDAGGTATATEIGEAPREIDGNESLFVELNKEVEAEKILIRLLRRYRDDKREHAEGIAGLKKTMDESEEAVITKMHELKLERGVKLDGEIFSIEPKGEGVKVRKDKTKKAAEDDE